LNREQDSGLGATKRSDATTIPTYVIRGGPQGRERLRLLSTLMWSTNIGPRLPGLLAGAGLTDVSMNVVQLAGMAGNVKLISPITLEAIADAVLAAGLATPEEFNAAVDELYAFAHADGTVMSTPRFVQTWGWRSPTA
jgi:hypothetical protein